MKQNFREVWDGQFPRYRVSGVEFHTVGFSGFFSSILYWLLSWLHDLMI